MQNHLEEEETSFYFEGFRPNMIDTSEDSDHSIFRHFQDHLSNSSLSFDFPILQNHQPIQQPDMEQRQSDHPVQKQEQNDVLSTDETIVRPEDQNLLSADEIIVSVEPNQRRRRRQRRPRIAKKCRCCHKKKVYHHCPHTECQGNLCPIKLRRDANKAIKTQRRQRNQR